MVGKPYSVTTLLSSIVILYIFLIFIYCRYNGQCIMYMLMSHEDFDKMLKKYLAANTLRSVQDKIDILKKKVCYILPSWQYWYIWNWSTRWAMWDINELRYIEMCERCLHVCGLIALMQSPRLCQWLYSISFIII